MPKKQREYTPELETLLATLSVDKTFALLAAAKYALADAQIFDWIIAEEAISKKDLADLRGRINTIVDGELVTSSKPKEKQSELAEA